MMIDTLTTSANAARHNPATRYLRQPEVLARIGVSWMTLRRWEDAYMFPRRRKLGPNAVGWLEHEINEWIASREAKLVVVAR